MQTMSDWLNNMTILLIAAYMDNSLLLKQRLKVIFRGLFKKKCIAYAKIQNCWYLNAYM